MWQDGLQATDSPESVNALSPVVEFHVRSLKNLFGDQTVCSDHPRPAHLIEDVDKGQSVIALQRHCYIRTLLRCKYLGESV